MNRRDEKIFDGMGELLDSVAEVEQGKDPIQVFGSVSNAAKAATRLCRMFNALETICRTLEDKLDGT